MRSIGPDRKILMSADTAEAIGEVSFKICGMLIVMLFVDSVSTKKKNKKSLKAAFKLFLLPGSFEVNSFSA